MARLISRQEAATLLEVDYQTVSNWINKGALTAHVINGRTFLDKKSIVKNFDSLHQLSQAEMHIKQLVKEAKELEQQSEQRLLNINKNISEAANIPTSVVGKAFQCVIEIASIANLLSERECDMLFMLSNGKTLNDLSREFSVTPQTISLNVSRAFSKLGDLDSVRDDISECSTFRKERESLKNYILNLKKELSKLQESNKLIDDKKQKMIELYGGIEGIRRIVEILQTRIVDTNLSMRAINCLRTYGILHIEDLVHWSRTDLKKIRNLGEVTFKEIDRFLHSLGLVYCMDTESILSVYREIEIGIIDSNFVQSPQQQPLT